MDLAHLVVLGLVPYAYSLCNAWPPFKLVIIQPIYP
jgi:hypothetical protein